MDSRRRAIRRTSSRDATPPVGLLGTRLPRHHTLVEPSEDSSIGTHRDPRHRTSGALASAAKRSSMSNVGSGSSTGRSGPEYARQMRSSASSAPAVTTTRSGSTPAWQRVLPQLPWHRVAAQQVRTQGGQFASRAGGGGGPSLLFRRSSAVMARSATGRRRRHRCTRRFHRGDHLREQLSRHGGLHCVSLSPNRRDTVACRIDGKTPDCVETAAEAFTSSITRRRARARN